MQYFIWFCFLVILKLVHSASVDMKLRRTTYTLPLERMLGNVCALKSEIITANDKQSWGVSGTDDEFDAAIKKLLAEGASLERNARMNEVRSKLTIIGKFLSAFMKEKGISYEDLYKKYSQKYPLGQVDDEIIKAACRANPDLFRKLVMTLAARLKLPHVVTMKFFAEYGPAIKSRL